MKIQKCYCFGLLLLLCSCLSHADQERVSLVVSVSGAIPDKGQAIFSLFDNEDDFLKLPLINEITPIDSQGGAAYTFEALEVGTYAIAVAYDEDGDGKLDTGFLGIPTELVGFSNNAKGRFGPPSFEKASFVLSSFKTLQVILGKAKD